MLYCAFLHPKGLLQACILAPGSLMRRISICFYSKKTEILFVVVIRSTPDFDDDAMLVLRLFSWAIGSN